MPLDFDPSKYIFTYPGLQSILQQAIDFFNNTTIQPLPPPVEFRGPGVYGLYYVGDFPPYQVIAQSNQGQAYILPIYIGKAVLPGARTGSSAAATSIYGRLQEHTENINFASNLRIEDFFCRFIILQGPESDLISAVESELFRRYRPLWNKTVKGFGNHIPGEGRIDQSPSPWDVLHPGRPWVASLTGARRKRTEAEVIASIQKHLGQPRLF